MEIKVGWLVACKTTPFPSSHISRKQYARYVQLLIGIRWYTLTKTKIIKLDMLDFTHLVDGTHGGDGVEDGEKGGGGAAAENGPTSVAAAAANGGAAGRAEHSAAAAGAKRITPLLEHDEVMRLGW